MNTIDIYDIVKNIPHVEDQQARMMADTIARVDVKELVTKGDLKTAITEMEARILKQLFTIAGIVIASNAFVIIVLKFFS